MSWFSGKEIRILLKGQAKQAYLELKQRTDKDAQTLVKSIERIFEIIKKNPQFGDPIKKEIIPESFKKQGIKNMYRVELSNFWRMLYTLESNRVEVLIFILSIVDHPMYDKLFGYRKK